MNNKILKAGILIGLLVIPALVFIFLKTFGDNQFELPRYFPELDDSGQVQLVDGDTLFHSISNFSLNNLDEEVVSLESLDEKIKVLNFFSAKCDSVCQAVKINLSRVRETFKKDKVVTFLSIGIETRFDSLDHAKRLDLNIENWHFLTGSEENVKQLAVHEFKLPFNEDSTGLPERTSIIVQPVKVFLLDKKNYVRGIYDAVDLNEIERLRLEIKVLKDIMKD